MAKVEIMKKWNRTISDIFFSLLLAGELAVLFDTVSVFCGKALSVLKFALLFGALAAFLLLIPAAGRKVRKTAALIILTVVGLPLLVGTICWNSVSRNATYNAVDDGKARLYGGQKVMLLVPHQDDDINVLGGVMEEYVKYGSEVYVVFSTNGDYYGKAEVRFREALNALDYLGVPEDHVIFLGYGDQWNADGPHLYNAEPGQVMTSVYGMTETYGTAAAPAYRPGRSYTIDNFLQDIEGVILEHRPDVIYCVDYDYNIDHRALSHGFEKVMGRILKAEADYRPLVLKGYAYNTAWEAVNDFYSDNLLATQNAFSEQYNPVPEVYRWKDRVRLPVHAEGLSRSVISAGQNRALSMYASQGANMYGARIINSDKVFWQRRTDSLCVGADVQTSSGDAWLLNDFMLLECHDLLNGQPYDGVWIPGEGDTERQVKVVFGKEETVSSIVLYDHPDETQNVLNARIEFDDGFCVEIGPLDPSGVGTAIPVAVEAVSSFTVTLLETEGNAGLTEIEAFSQGETWQPEFVKITDETGNFVYDYWIDPTGVQRFSLYDPSGMATEYDVFCLNQNCSAVREGEEILVECPVGESCVVYVTGENGERLDTVYIRNPGSLERAWITFWLRAEESVMKLCDTKRLHERLFVCRLAEKLPDLLEKVTGR